MNESDSGYETAIKAALAPLFAWRWLALKFGGDRAKCRWDGHKVSEPHDAALVSLKRCDRCDKMVRVK